MRIVFDHTVEEAGNIRTFYFNPEKPVNYTAGQFAEWTLEHKNPDSLGQKRWFTISSSPTDEMLSFTTKFTDPIKESTFKKALLELKLGDELLVSNPMGDFVLPKLIQTPLVFVAGGIGITPIHSMLKWLAATNETRPIKLLYGVRTEDEIVFQETFDGAGIRATIVVSDPSSAWGGERGRLSAELILGLEKPSDDSLVYISGPEPMVQKLEKDLIKAGLKKRQLVIDEFSNYAGI